jgi:hypothetical protein
MRPYQRGQYHRERPPRPAGERGAEQEQGGERPDEDHQEAAEIY